MSGKRGGSRLAHLQTCRRLCELPQVTRQQSSLCPLIFTPVLPGGAAQWSPFQKALWWNHLSTGKYNLFLLREDMVTLLVGINWHQEVLLLKEFLSDVMLLQGSHAFHCTIILFYCAGCKWIHGSSKSIHKKQLPFVGWYSGGILESESKPSTGFGGSAYRGEVKTIVFLCWQKHFEMFQHCNPRHNNKYVVGINSKRWFS